MLLVNPASPHHRHHSQFVIVVIDEIMQFFVILYVLQHPSLLPSAQYLDHSCLRHGHYAD